MKLKYEPTGYLDMADIINNPFPFCFIVGARGTGKTYGAVKYLYSMPKNQRFIFLRRTQDQTEVISRQDTNPFKTLVEREGVEPVECKKVTKQVGGYYLNEHLIGYAAALTTFANIRGPDFWDVTTIIYDEFIKERHQRAISNEGAALLNIYESVNRNRELDGKPPVKLVCLANADDIANPYFTELHLVTVAEKMLKKHTEVYTNKERGIFMALLQNSAISQRKQNTALYRLVDQSSDFYKMAICNDFNIEDGICIGSRNLIEYKPAYQIGELCIYKHKSGQGYYICGHISGKPVVYGSGEMEKSRFCRQHPEIWDAYMRREIVFEQYLYIRLFESYYLK